MRVAYRHRGVTSAKRVNLLSFKNDMHSKRDINDEPHCHALPAFLPPPPPCLTYYSNKLHESQHSIRRRGRGTESHLQKTQKCVGLCEADDATDTHTQRATLRSGNDLPMVALPLYHQPLLPPPSPSRHLYTLSLFTITLLPCLLRFIFSAMLLLYFFSVFYCGLEGGGKRRGVRGIRG